MDRTLQNLLVRHGREACRGLPAFMHRAAMQMSRCRTAALGGHVQACPDGHIHRVWYNSCRHRNCPQCNYVPAERWLTRQRARLIDCPHHHMIFTVAHELIPLWMRNPAALIDVLFQATRDTLTMLCEDPRYLGARPGFILSYHSWGRNLSVHPHVHCLITDGGLKGSQWTLPRRKHFLPIRVVMVLFRGKFLGRLRALIEANTLTLPDSTDRQHWLNIVNRIGRKSWNVHIRKRYDHGHGVTTYLARYIRGGPIDTRQIRTNDDGARVQFRHHDHQSRQRRTQHSTSAAFLRRFLLHVPPPGRQLVRHYGLYAHRSGPALNAARNAVGQRAVCILAKPSWQSLYITKSATAAPPATHCPTCHQPLRRVHTIGRSRAPPW